MKSKNEEPCCGNRTEFRREINSNRQKKNFVLDDVQFNDYSVNNHLN